MICRISKQMGMVKKVKSKCILSRNIGLNGEMESNHGSVPSTNINPCTFNPFKIQIHFGLRYTSKIVFVMEKALWWISNVACWLLFYHDAVDSFSTTISCLAIIDDDDNRWLWRSLNGFNHLIKYRRDLLLVEIFGGSSMGKSTWLPIVWIDTPKRTRTKWVISFFHVRLSTDFNVNVVVHICHQIAILWESDDPKHHDKITYQQLLENTCQLANVFKSLGLKKGDTVAIYLPMVPQAAVSMLACARLGLIHRYEQTCRVIALQALSFNWILSLQTVLFLLVSPLTRYGIVFRIVDAHWWSLLIKVGGVGKMCL